MTLEQFFEENTRVALAFSGGVDSAYLLYAAAKYAKAVKAYYVKTAFQPQFELEDAKRLANSLNVRLEILGNDVLCKPEITENPANRCYFCKKQIFETIFAAARRDGFPVLMDGTNASDDAADRPGMQALRELSVRSPLRECGLSKQQVRELSREASLFTWNKPAYACLATRIPTGEVITAEKLRITESAEDYLFSLGLKDFRVRMRGADANVQVRREDLPFVLERWEQIVAQLGKSYDSVTLDREVYR